MCAYCDPFEHFTVLFWFFIFSYACSMTASLFFFSFFLQYFYETFFFFSSVFFWCLSLPGPCCYFFFFISLHMARLPPLFRKCCSLGRSRDASPGRSCPCTLRHVYFVTYRCYYFNLRSIPFFFSSTSEAEPVSSIHSVYTIIYNMAGALPSPS